MADIIAKIGKYFADQESQMREMYAQAAAAAAATSVPAKSAVKAPSQPSTDVSKDHSGDFKDVVVERPPSLLRRRLMTTEGGRHADNDAKIERVDSGAAGMAKGARDRSIQREGKAIGSALTSRSDGDESSDNGSRSAMSTSDVVSSSASSASSRKVKVLKKKKKPKKKKTVTSEKSEEDEKIQKRQQLEIKAEEGLARAQERARRIQMEKLLQSKQQQQERDANTARLQEEMRKIEEIRQKGKQFALRLRPQSAPSTPQSSQTTIGSARWREAEGKETDKGERPEQEAKRSFLNELEREMHDQMMLELVVSERARRKHTQEQQEWARLQSQIKKTTDRNDIRVERVRSLNEKKKQLENQIEHAQNEAMNCRQERHQLEEKSKKERIQKQREAEREIYARLRNEESQRLVEEERKQSDDAADARAKAKLRVQSRASLLKRVLHGCDVRAERTKSQNQEEAIEVETVSLPVTSKSTGRSELEQDHSPELAEFEEDGLFEDFAMAQVEAGVVLSPTKRMLPASSSAEMNTASERVRGDSLFEWRVPSLPITQIHNILRAELLIDNKDD